MGEWTKFWDAIDSMKREHDETKAKINRRPGWKFTGCELFGAKQRWRAEFQEVPTDVPDVIERPTSMALILEIATRDGLCPKCLHKLIRCRERGCTAKGCGCVENKKEPPAAAFV